MKFFAAGRYAFRSENKAKVGHFGVAEKAFGQVDLELILLKFGKNLVEQLQMMFVGGRMNDDVVGVDNDVADAISMSGWNEAGQPNRPIGDVTHSN